jgi:protein-tyrosine phosphatase
MIHDAILWIGALVLALVLGSIAYLGWQATIKPADYEAMFEVREDEPGDQIIQSGKRMIRLEGAVNFRDLGGYKTVGGKRVAWGRVYRADDLSRLSEKDVNTLQDLGIKLFCDLRSHPEVKERPDRVPEGIAYLHLPVFAKDPIGRLRALLLRHRLDPLFKRFYRDSIVDEGAPALGTLLKLVADPANLPLVFHCTGGKDRTGVAAALLLHICGVPREMIILDYSLTNLSAEKFLSGLREVFSATRLPPGIKLEQYYPLLSARPELIEQAFAHIETKYGSIDQYSRGPAGLSEDDIEAIRQNLLIDEGPVAI